MSENREKCILRARWEIFKFFLLSDQQSRTQILILLSYTTNKSIKFLHLRSSNEQIFIFALKLTETNSSAVDKHSAMREVLPDAEKSVITASVSRQILTESVVHIFNQTLFSASNCFVSQFNQSLMMNEAERL